MKHHILFLYVLCLIAPNLWAQQHPSAVDWHYISTEHFELVFPKEIEQTAQRVANELEHYYLPASQSLDTVPSKIAIYLSNRSTASNGYVRLFPRYSLWYATPNPETNQLGNDDWFRSMGIHEYRHMVQFDKANQKFTKFFSRLFGDLVRTGLAWSVPMWFVEGDAVVIETALTGEGRGRIPSFGMPIRASLLEDRTLSYEQAYLGSFRKYFPNYYTLGYYMVGQARNEYGAKIWSKATDKYSAYSFWPFALSHATKKLTGHNFRSLYHNTMQALDSSWREKLNHSPIDTFGTLTSPVHDWTNFTFPQVTEQGDILALRNGQSYFRDLVKIDSTGRVRRIKKLASEQFHYAAGKVVWAEEYSDLRWQERSFSNIRVYTLKSKKTRRITQKGKYFSPALSPDGEKIAAVEFTPQLKASLVVIDAKQGTVLLRKTIGDNEMIRNPQWSDNGKRIVFTHSKYKGAALSVLNTENLTVKNLKPHSWEVISHPRFVDAYVCYNSAYSGKDALYAIDTLSLQEWQICNGKYGVFQASSTGDSIVFQNYTADGFRVAHMSLSPRNWTPKNTVAYEGIDFHRQLATQEGGNIFAQKIDTTRRHIKKFPWWKRLINYHSLYVDPSQVSSVEISALFRNELNTLDLKGGLSYDNNERNWRYHSDISYKGFFPILSVSNSYGNRNRWVKAGEQLYQFNSPQNDFLASVTLPFNFSHGVYYKHISAWGSIQNSYLKAYESDLFTIPSTQNNFLGIGLNAHFLQLRPNKVVDYRIGLSSSLSFKELLGPELGQMISMQHSLYLPGLSTLHSIRLQVANERKTTGGYPFRSQVLFPRGYDYFYAHQFDRVSFDYSLPLFYPDIRCGSLLYINRLRAKLFFDAANIDKQNYHASGASLFTDFYVLQLNFPLSVGFRYARRLLDNKNSFEIVFVGLNFDFY